MHNQRKPDELDEKLQDLDIPGAEVEVDPDEADELGAFVEDALTEEEAKESAIDEHD